MKNKSFCLYFWKYRKVLIRQISSKQAHNFKVRESDISALAGPFSKVLEKGPGSIKTSGPFEIDALQVNSF